MLTINIAPVEGKIPVYHNNESDCETLVFPGLFSTGQFHDDYIKEVLMTPSKYIHSRSKKKKTNKIYAENPPCIFYCLDWLEKEIVMGEKQFLHQKQH